jgi:glycosyltransferase involved in cell wall biosynthesis
MRIGINASFARKPNNGTGQVTINFLKELARTSTSRFNLSDSKKSSKVEPLEFVLYLEEKLPKEIKLPKNFSTRVFLPAWKRDDLIRKIWWEKYLLPRKIKKDKIDVFFSLYQSATILPREIKHLMLIHDIIPGFFPGYLNNFRKKYYWQQIEKAIQSVDKIISVSKRTEKDIVQYLNVDPSKISVNYIDVDEIYKTAVSKVKSQKVLRKYRLKPGYILAGGGLEVRKNVEGTIRAYKKLIESNKILHFAHEIPPLVVYGKLLPQLAPLVTNGEKLAKDLNLTKEIKLLDMVPQEDMPAIFSEALMFVYPSFYEGFGMPPLEAMNQGTPVVTSKASSVPEVGGDAVLYCDPDDTKDIAMVMRNVLINENLRATLSRRGQERARMFSWKKFVEKFLNIAVSFRT